MSEEQKPFEYMELKAMCMLCAVRMTLIMSDMRHGKFTDEKEARMELEKQIDRIIDLRWNDPSKQVVKDD